MKLKLSLALPLAALLAALLPFGAIASAVPIGELLQRAALAPVESFPALDLDALAAEDALRDSASGYPKRFALAQPVDLTPNTAGAWSQLPDGDWLWQLRVRNEDAAHLNFGFSEFALPPGAELNLIATDGSNKVGPFTAADMLPHRQLWTPVVLGEETLLHLRVPAAGRIAVVLRLSAINLGYRGFGARSKACKSGSCNTDVACLSDGDPWNLPRRSVGAWTRAGTDTCTGSLLNNTAGDRRMLFSTATHCGVSSDAVAATVLVYWNYESPTCRVPTAGGQSPVLPKPATTSAGVRLLAQTANPFAGSAPAGNRSDFALIELATPAPGNTFNLYWAGWDRRAPSPTAMLCAAPADPASTAGLCASIHHPGVDEKRITFVETNLTLDNIASATGVHWRANWDPTPPRLPNIVPMPTTLPPSVTEPGSSGSPLYNAEQRLVGVLSGGPSACGSTGVNLRDQYGGLFHAWDGLGTPATRVRDLLDPGGTNPEFIDGIGNCIAPAAPQTTTVSVTAPNQITVTWSAVSGINTYRVLRSVGTCPGSGFQQIAQVTGGQTSYVDTSVSGGTSYVYRVAAFDTAAECQSVAGPCANAIATGTCALAPGFAGLGSATSAGNSSCGIALDWNAGSGNCGAGSDLRYNVYRSASAGFGPAPTNLLASCLTVTDLLDINVLPGQPQSYIVRAEDLGALPASGQCGGVEEANVIIRTAAAFGPNTIIFSDDAESGPGQWTVDGTGGGANFALVSTASSSPTRSWYVPDPTIVSDRRMILASPLALAPGTNAVLEFNQRYQAETNWDGGVLEYSLDGGTAWSDILAAQGTVAANPARFLAGGYVSALNAGNSTNPLAGRPAWHGSIATFQPTRVNLADFGGRSVLLRLRFGSDGSVGGNGWWIDDIRVLEGTACQTVPLDQFFANGFEG